MAKKFYAVRKGAKTGIFDSWDECKALVSSYTGAEYKGFATREDAEEYLCGHEKPADSTPAVCEMVAYVDGSYSPHLNLASYGAVILRGGRESHLSGLVDVGGGFTDMRNVAGEIKGAEAAILFAIKRRCRSLEIVHDYVGIAEWATGGWKANRPGTVAYRDFCRAVSQKLHIQFRKVKGHSGDKYNELADKLAKAKLDI